MSRLALLGLSVIAYLGMVMLGLALPLMAIAGNKERADRALDGLDVVLNVMTGGTPPEYLSSRAERARHEGRRWGCVLCRLLDMIDAKHCEKSRGKRWGG